MLGLIWQVAAGVDSQALRAGSPAAPHGAASELLVKNPVPGFLGQLFQWAFNQPKWLQWGGIALGAVVGLVIAYQLFTRRDAVFAWFASRSHGYKMGLAAVAAVMLLGAGGVGYAGNHYMQHNNDFCSGCHVMGDAWGAFQRSEHRKLECHNCHRQSMFASAKQLYFWIAERPQEIPKHAKVPTGICSECHVQSEADSNWKRIVATAGHRLHLKSDSSALKKVACVTCHGQEVHRFKPVDKTCGQSGCHQSKDTKIVLGTMAGQTSQHCTGCHTFTRAVPENISMDSTRKFLVASGSQQSCFGCHQMQQKLKGFEPRDDRGHNGVCGTCHNPHKQTTPKQAYESCASGGCHSDLATKNKFHAGLPAHTTASCGECHKAHEWKAVGRECIDCHKNIFNAKPRRSASRGYRGLVRFSLVRRADRRSSGKVRALTVMRRQSGQVPSVVPPKDKPSFSHKKHQVLACSGCHDQKATHGAVNVRTAAECAACHHSPERSVSCEGCHDARGKLAGTFTRTVTMKTSAATPARARTLSFAHRAHRDLECKGCHTQGILLGVTKDCLSCHADHHKAERACISCHQPPAKTAHARAAHEGCAGSTCHTNAEVLALTPSRATCVSCHTAQANHKPKRECAECHAVTWGNAAGNAR